MLAKVNCCSPFLLDLIYSNWLKKIHLYTTGELLEWNRSNRSSCIKHYKYCSDISKNIKKIRCIEILVFSMLLFYNNYYWTLVRIVCTYITIRTSRTSIVKKSFKTFVNYNWRSGRCVNCSLHNNTRLIWNHSLACIIEASLSITRANCTSSHNRYTAEMRETHCGFLLFLFLLPFLVFTKNIVTKIYRLQ